MDVQQVIEIREATSQDLSALLVIELQCFHSDRLSQRSFRRFISEKRSDLFVLESDLSLISKLLKDGYILLALISTWQFDRSKAPHWIVICAVDADFVYINDPDVEDIPWLSPTERHYIPVSHHIFNKAFAYGKKRLKALLAIKKVWK